MADLTTNIILRVINRATGPMRQIRRSMAGIQQGARRMSRAFNIAGQVSIAQQGVERFASSMRKAVLAPLSDFEKFEQSMANVAALTGASNSELAKMGDTAKTLGLDTEFSASQSADAMAEFAKAGRDTGQIIDSIAPTLDLATASTVGLARTAEIMTEVMNQFGIKSDQSLDVANKLTAGFTGSAVTLESLGESMSYVGTQAAGLGIGLSEMIALTGALGDAGLKGSRGGTALNNMLARLTAARRRGAKVIKSIGLEIADESGNLRELPDIFADIAKGIGKFGEVKQAKALSFLFGVEASAGVRALMKAFAGDEKFKEFRESLVDTTGRVKEVAKVMRGTGKNAMDQLSSSIEGANIAVGETGLGGEFKKLKLRLAGWTNGVAKWIEQNPKLVKGIFMVIGALAIVATVLGLFMAALVPIISIGGLMMLAQGAGITAGALLALAAPIAVILVALAAVGAAIAMLVIHWDDLNFALGMKGIWITIKELIDDAVGSLDRFLSTTKSVARFVLSGIPGVGVLANAVLGPQGGDESAVAAAPSAPQQGMGNGVLRIEFMGDEGRARVVDAETDGMFNMEIASGPMAVGGTW